jgi:hypothetical protein
VHQHGERGTGGWAPNGQRRRARVTIPGIELYTRTIYFLYILTRLSTRTTRLSTRTQLSTITISFLYIMFTWVGSAARRLVASLRARPPRTSDWMRTAARHLAKCTRYTIQRRTYFCKTVAARFSVAACPTCRKTSQGTKYTYAV